MTDAVDVSSAPTSSDAWPWKPTVAFGFALPAGAWVVAHVLGATTTTVACAGKPELEPCADNLSIGEVLLAQSGLWISIPLLVLAAVKWKGSGRVRDDLSFRSSAADVPAGIGIGIGTQILVLPILYIVLRAVFGDFELSGVAERLVDAADGDILATVGLIVGVALVAPVVEELLYRGLIMHAIARRFGAQSAVIVQGVRFGMAHFQLPELPGLTLFGILAGALVAKTGRLGPAIWAHIGLNATALGFLLADIELW